MKILVYLTFTEALCTPVIMTTILDMQQRPLHGHYKQIKMLPVITTDIFQTSVTDIRCQKWFVETSQIITVASQIITVASQIITVTSQIITVTSQIITVTGQIITVTSQIITVTSQIITVTSQKDMKCLQQELQEK